MTEEELWTLQRRVSEYDRALLLHMGGGVETAAVDLAASSHAGLQVASASLEPRARERSREPVPKRRVRCKNTARDRREEERHRQ